ncbi:iron complex outermembrane receptor protein [Mariniflexile fucanivorans]|uniref:Iron complex outermembrane receptor protein n=1 Tax=Mariniflexile fucanivorans TaxID=264023 RepID=A0A4R1RL53_9FLAO|nr:TonB-dependent receptor [Mariniflexile fucanivorans]TCL66943.1 iron complex outermembrane receptor protein [Mariniflexile fucanivorans]
MKNLFFASVFFFSLYFAHSQQVFKGKIIDSENGTPLTNVTIKNAQNNSVYNSNNLGQFELPSKGMYNFSKAGYHEKQIEISKPEYIIIQLELNPSNLNEVIVNANHIPQKLQKANTTINIITSKDIQRGNTTNVLDVLNRVPGVFMQSGSLNTNKISIRGIGSRNLYGTSKIRAYFQDIPLTSGNGETTIEDFELGSISRFEIIKGAGSSIYGAGLGGTIHLIPQNAYLNQTTAQSDISFGSFGLMKSILNVNHGNKKHSFRAVYSNTHSDGYRDNNNYDRQTFTINTNHFLSNKDDITLLGSYTDLKGFIPSSINENDYLNNPKTAAFTWAQSKGYEDSKRGILGLSWNHQYNSNTKQITSVFSSFKEAYEPRPFDILTENTSAIGIRSRVLGTSKKLNWTLGGELFKDIYKSRNYENLYQNHPEGTGSVEGDKFSDFKEKRTYYNLFFETNYNLSEKTTFSVGLNFNKTSYNLIDRFVIDENPDQSGSYNFKGMLSPKFGISHVFSQNINIYSNVSHGFSPPTTAETLLPEGLINTNIKPETAWNFEVGTRSAFFNNRLQCNLALYRLDVRDLLVPRRTGNDQFIGVNAGRTLHNGLEMVLKYQWLQSKNTSINHYVSYTLNDFKFKEFIDDGNNFSGNKLTGVPSNLLNTGIDFDTELGFFVTINYQYLGRIPMTDSNTLFTDSYSLTNFKLGYKHHINKNLKLNAYFGINNMLDKHYASQILINAIGFGGSAPRYYYPGNPVNYYTGINISYLF